MTNSKLIQLVIFVVDANVCVFVCATSESEMVNKDGDRMKKAHKQMRIHFCCLFFYHLHIYV